MSSPDLTARGKFGSEKVITEPEFVVETVNLTIQGMHCGGCASKVSTALKTVPGARVEAVAVGSARISFDPEKTSATALIGVVDSLGFKAASAVSNS